MKYCLKFYSPDEVILPVQYNHIMQAALFEWLEELEYTTFLHDEGYKEGTRKFKLYTFSNLYGHYQYYAESKKIGFSGEITFYCSFYEERSEKLIRRNVERMKPLRLGEKKLAFLKCDVIEEVYEDCIVEAVSPITIHSTVSLPDGRKRTYYYEPHDVEFSEMIRQNLIRKYKAYHGCEPENPQFSVTCIPKENYIQAGIYYRRFVIKGWRGRFVLQGSEELIKLALLSGLGARNSIGCGCIVQKNQFPPVG